MKMTTIIKNKKILIIFSAVLAVILLISLWWYPAVKDINRRYPSYTVNEIPNGGTAAIGDITLSAGNLRFYTMQDFSSTFMSDDESGDIVDEVLGSYDPSDVEVALVDYTITYTGDGEMTPGEIIDEYMIYIQSGFSSGAYDMLFIRDVNLHEIPKTLANGDSCMVTLPYFVSEFSFGKSHEQLKKQGFSAVVNYYPDRFLIKL